MALVEVMQARKIATRLPQKGRWATRLPEPPHNGVHERVRYSVCYRWLLVHVRRPWATHMSMLK